MFEKQSDAGWRLLAEGVEIKPMAYGEKTLMVQFRFRRGHKLPLHQHPHEQTGTLLTGHIRLVLAGGEVYDALPGDSWTIPGGVEHSGEFLEDSLAIEVFSPVREEYLR